MSPLIPSRGLSVILPRCLSAGDAGECWSYRRSSFSFACVGVIPTEDGVDSDRAAYSCIVHSLFIAHFHCHQQCAREQGEQRGADVRQPVTQLSKAESGETSDKAASCFYRSNNNNINNNKKKGSVQLRYKGTFTEDLSQASRVERIERSIPTVESLQYSIW